MRAAPAGASAAALALVAIAALAVHSDGGASAGAQKAQLWTHVGADADTSTQRVAVTDADVNNLGLKAPAGFNVPSIEVSDADVARLGLKAPPGLPAVEKTDATVAVVTPPPSENGEEHPLEETGDVPVIARGSERGPHGVTFSAPSPA